MTKTETQKIFFEGGIWDSKYEEVAVPFPPVIKVSIPVDLARYVAKFTAASPSAPKLEVQEYRLVRNRWGELVYMENSMYKAEMASLHRVQGRDYHLRKIKEHVDALEKL